MLEAMVNWSAVGVIAAVVIAAAGGVGKLILRRADRAEAQATSKAAELNLKLDKIGHHLASQDRQHDRLAERVAIDHRHLAERVARIEGAGNRIERAITESNE